MKFLTKLNHKYNKAGVVAGPVVDIKTGKNVSTGDPAAWKKAAKAANEGHWLDRYIGIAEAFSYKTELAVFKALKDYQEKLGHKPPNVEKFLDGVALQMLWKLEATNPTDEQWASVVWGFSYEALKAADLLKYKKDGSAKQREDG